MNLEIIDQLKKGNSLLKFAYIGFDGTNNFERIINSNDYKSFNNEMVIIEQNLLTITDQVRDRLVVLGVGNGKKLIQISKRLYTNKEIILIDLSKEFLDKTKNIIKGNVITEQGCFETMNMSKFGKNSTFLILGSTLGNLKNYEFFLKKLKCECQDSNAIIGMEFYDNVTASMEKILDAYKSMEAFRFVFNPLKKLGFGWEHGDFKVFFNTEQERVEKHFVFNDNSKNKKKQLGLENIESALLASSLKPTKMGFILKLIQNNYDIGSLFTNDRNSIFEFSW